MALRYLDACFLAALHCYMPTTQAAQQTYAVWTGYSSTHRGYWGLPLKSDLECVHVTSLSHSRIFHNQLKVCEIIL